MTVGGSVFNQSTKNLIVAYNDDSLPGKPFRHTLLKAGDRTPGLVDVDGFRGEQDNVTITFRKSGSGESWNQWWRIRGLTVATVVDDGSDLKFIIVNDFYLDRLQPEKKTDTDFEWEPPGTELKPFKSSVLP